MPYSASRGSTLVASCRAEAAGNGKATLGAPPTVSQQQICSARRIACYHVQHAKLSILTIWAQQRCRFDVTAHLQGGGLRDDAQLMTWNKVNGNSRNLKQVQCISAPRRSSC